MCHWLHEIEPGKPDNGGFSFGSNNGNLSFGQWLEHLLNYTTPVLLSLTGYGFYLEALKCQYHRVVVSWTKGWDGKEMGVGVWLFMITNDLMQH